MAQTAFFKAILKFCTTNKIIVFFFSPTNEVIFMEENLDPKTGRYLYYFSLTNLCGRDQVAYKIKTNSPKHYLVKPNIGFVAPGKAMIVLPGLYDTALVYIEVVN